MGVGVKFSNGWGKFTRLFSNKAKRKFQKKLQKKIAYQLGLLRRDIVSYIDSEKHGIANSPLTILTKGSSRPLVDHGDLRSVNIRTEIDGDSVHGGVGVLRTKMNKDGNKLWNIAIALHDGFVVNVTPKVRAAVFAEMKKRQGKKVRFESSDSLKKWKVKGRPFIEKPFKDAESRIRLALGDAVEVILHKE